MIEWRHSQQNPGQLTGYRIGRVGDLNGQGNQVWFSGSKLAPELSLPKLESRWQEVAAGRLPRQRPVAGTDKDRRGVLVRAERGLARVAAGSPTSVGAVAAGETAAALARVVEGDGGGPLTDAAELLARAARQPGGVRPAARDRVHDLRFVAAELALLGHLLPGEAGHVLLITAHLARIAAAISTRPRDLRIGAWPVSPEQRTAAALAAESLYAHAGIPGSGERTLVEAALGSDLADRVSRDPAWPALARALRDLDAAGEDPGQRLAAAARSRELDSARSEAAVLRHRLLAPEQQAQTVTTQTGTAPAVVRRPGSARAHPRR